MPFWHPKRKIGDFPNLLLQIFFRKGQTVARLRFDGTKRRGKRTKSLVVRKTRQHDTSRSTMAMWKLKKYMLAHHTNKNTIVSIAIRYIRTYFFRVVCKHFFFEIFIHCHCRLRCIMLFFVLRGAGESH